MKVQNKPCWVQVVKEIIIGILLLACPFVFGIGYYYVESYYRRLFKLHGVWIYTCVVAIVVGIILLSLILAIFKKKISQIGLLIMSVLMLAEVILGPLYWLLGGSTIGVMTSTLFFVFLLGGLILSRTKTFQNQSE